MRILTTAVVLAATVMTEERAQQSCKPEFPFRDGWWGTDGGYSIPLPSGETFWLFDDSFIGTAKNKNRFVFRPVSRKGFPWPVGRETGRLRTYGAYKDTWCYQPIAHPEFRRADKILLTHACNSFKWGKLVSDLRIYVPKAVYVRLP